MIELLQISTIIPTANRASVLEKTLMSIANQSNQPSEIIIIDASEDSLTEELILRGIPKLVSKTIWKRATIKGAATQRNQGVELAKYDYIFFCDDDILFEQNCIERLWNAINSNDKIGGVNAMITNQKYVNPGIVTQFMYWLMSGKFLSSYAGKCIGPAWNLLPEEGTEPLQKVEWLNTTCTIYKKLALPCPPFPSNFYGYSLMEDLTLSLIVGKSWTLYNVRDARIYHDSQPGSHKNNEREMSKMELVNRHYVMTHVLKRVSVSAYLRLFVFELFGLVTSKNFFNAQILRGKIDALKIIFND